MTDCDNVDIRELLPDFAAGQLAPHQVERVRSHVRSCALCADELAIIQSVRSVRPAPAPVDVQRIVAALPRAPRAAVAVSPLRARSRVWQLAAAIGVIVVGGGSLMVARNGGFVSVATLAVDSAGTRSDSAVRNGRVDSTPGSVAALPSVPEMAVSFGNVGDYSDEELDRILDRLDQWDGATSTESMTTQPIVPVNQGGTSQ